MDLWAGIETAPLQERSRDETRGPSGRPTAGQAGLSASSAARAAALSVYQVALIGV